MIGRAFHPEWGFPPPFSPDTKVAFIDIFSPSSEAYFPAGICGRYEKGFLAGERKRNTHVLLTGKNKTRRRPLLSPPPFFLIRDFLLGPPLFPLQNGERRKKTAPPTHPMFCEVYFFLFSHSRVWEKRETIFFRDE